MDTYLLLRAFVDELARCGMEAACTAPGSRSAPLVLSLAHEPRLRCYPHIDERCAGFFALGLAKASGRPVAVACTSGTAAAELLPAAIEAREARVPLLLLTADRPPELRETGAGQAIDQLKLFGSAAKWFFEVDVPQAGEAQLRWMRTLACRAYWTALEGRPGVVHLNFPLREPLVIEEPLGEDHSAREQGRPYVERAPARLAAPRAARTLLEIASGAARPVVVAGRHERGGDLAASVAGFCARAGWPLLADPLSGARRGAAAVAHYDALLRDERFASAMTPDLVLRVGDLPTSKPLRGWLERDREVRQVALDSEGAWQDPSAALSDSLALDPGQALSALEAGLAAPARQATPTEGAREWLERWRAADERAAEALRTLLGAGALSEPRAAAELGARLPGSSTLFVASSMPVRDIESFWPAREDPPRVLCNRGANGIDGTVSSAFGAAAAGERVVLMIGDVALAHDIGGLAAARRLGLALTIVLLNNGGGGIFDFLPIAAAPMGRLAEPGRPPGGEDIYERHIATPPKLDFSLAARIYGFAHAAVTEVDELLGALERGLQSGGSQIIEVRCERAENVALHREAWRAVSSAINSRAPAAARPA